MKKKKLVLFLIAITAFFNVKGVNAISYTSGTCYHFNHTTGAYSTSGSGDVGTDCIKKIGDKYAYCTQWRIPASGESGYTKDSNWKENSKRAIIVGMIIDEVNKKYNGTQAYAMTAAVINTYFNKSLNSSGSRNFYSTNKTVKGIYDDVMKKYKINRRISYLGEPLKQKWNGIAQHISALVLDSSDIIIITIFSTLGDVSIYSIYMLVIKGIKQLCLSMINGIQALIGRIWAQKDLDTLKQIFCWAEWTIHTFTVLIFSLTAVLIIPFIEIFTFSISDVDYIQPKFAVLLVIANSLYCLSLPYLMMILAASHYKQTQNKFIFSAAVNVLVSIFCLREFGLVGIAMGTFVAMAYQVIWMWKYTYNNLINLSLKHCIKQVMVDIIGFSMIYFVCNFFCSETANYFEWTLIAIKTTIIGIAISATINYIFYKQFIVVVFKKIYKY